MKPEITIDSDDAIVNLQDPITNQDDQAEAHETIEITSTAVAQAFGTTPRANNNDDCCCCEGDDCCCNNKVLAPIALGMLLIAAAGGTGSSFLYKISSVMRNSIPNPAQILAMFGTIGVENGCSPVPVEERLHPEDLKYANCTKKIGYENATETFGEWYQDAMNPRSGGPLAGAILLDIFTVAIPVIAFLIVTGFIIGISCHKRNASKLSQSGDVEMKPVTPEAVKPETANHKEKKVEHDRVNLLDFDSLETATSSSALQPESLAVGGPASLFATTTTSSSSETPVQEKTVELK